MLIGHVVVLIGVVSVVVVVVAAELKSLKGAYAVCVFFFVGLRAVFSRFFICRTGSQLAAILTDLLPRPHAFDCLYWFSGTGTGAGAGAGTGTGGWCCL